MRKFSVVGGLLAAALLTSTAFAQAPAPTNPPASGQG